MYTYRIFVDSSVDMPASVLADWEVDHSCLRFYFEGEEKEYLNDEMTAKEFYDRMRAGGTIKTSAVNSEDFRSAFEAILSGGQDILYIGFSGGLSTTCNCARIAAQELLEDFPERKILIVDSLSASAGYGLLTYLTVEKRRAGATIEEAAAFAEDMKLHLCHWFTPDDLSYLLRGGRVANAVANIGGKLKLKPVMHMDDAGHLIPVSVARGRKKSLQALGDQYGKLCEEKGRYPVYLCHADCAEDALFLENYLNEVYNTKVDRTVDVGPVIGGHTGPGVVSLFFVGKER